MGEDKEVKNHTVQQERSPGSPAPHANGSKSKASVFQARYGECLKNHAAVTGGNVTDGCGEFMPSGETGTQEAFNCAACNCHRNFHRKELNTADAITVRPPPRPLPSASHHYRVVEPVAVHSNHWTGMVQPVKIAIGGAESSSEELYYHTYNQSQTAQPPPQYVLSKKRFRTKFTAEQKDKMLEFADKLGWRIPREDDSEMQRFCAEVEVKRQAFKVWMHNNKSSRKINLEKKSGDLDLEKKDS